MKPYKSLSGKRAGVIAYEIGENYILIQFDKKKIYKYVESSNSKEIIDHMKMLAEASRGLTSYIIKNHKTLKYTIPIQHSV